MFEKVSGFFKRFTRRRKQQSGETTIMDGKESSPDDFGLDEGFDDMAELGEAVDSVGTVPVGAESRPDSEGGFSDFDLGSDDVDISTGGSDFDARTISDEISGAETGLAEGQDDFTVPLSDEAEVPSLGETFAEPEPVSPVKRIVTLVVIAIVAIAAGAAGQIFLWPMVAPMLGFGGSGEPKHEVEALVGVARRENARLRGELNDFQAIGGLEEVKALQQQIAAVRDTDGKMDEFTKKHGLAKKKEAAYDALIARVGKIESNISKTRAQITDVESQIKDARERVVRLAEQSEEEFERFRLELVRFELSQRLLIELKMEDIESFRAEISQLQEHLSELSPPAIPAASSENASIVGASEAESFED